MLRSLLLPASTPPPHPPPAGAQGTPAWGCSPQHSLSIKGPQGRVASDAHLTCAQQVAPVPARSPVGARLQRGSQLGGIRSQCIRFAGRVYPQLPEGAGDFCLSFKA